MKGFKTLAVMMTISGVWQSASSASAEPGPPPRFERFHGRFGEEGTSRVLEMMSERLDLTADQKEQVAKILSESREAVRAGMQDHRATLEQTRGKIAAVLTQAQKEKAKELRRGVAAGIGGYLDAHGPEMRERAGRAGKEIRLRAALATLKLTDEQRSALKEVAKSTDQRRDEIMEAVKPQMEALHDDAVKRIHEVLTPEQKSELDEKLSKMPPGAPFGGPRGPQHGPGSGGGPHRRPGRGGFGPEHGPSQCPSDTSPKAP